MGKYFEAIKPYTYFNPKLLQSFRPPKIIKEGFHYTNWQENKAQKLVLDFSALTYLGMLSALKIKKDAVQRIVASSEHIKRGSLNRGKNIDELILARQLSVNSLFPKEELPKNMDANISLLGLIGLGMLRVIYPDKVGEGMLRIYIMSLLLQKDAFAALVREKFPNIFIGYKDIDELSAFLFQSKLQPEHFKELYNFINLKK